MRDLLSLIRWMLLGRFRSKASLEAEILALRHQLNVLRRTSPRRPDLIEHRSAGTAPYANELPTSLPPDGPLASPHGEWVPLRTETGFACRGSLLDNLLRELL